MPSLAASAAATVKGFMTLKAESGIAGVLVNRVSGAHHYELVRDAAAHYTGLPCVGYIEKNVRAESARHAQNLSPDGWLSHGACAG